MMSGETVATGAPIPPGRTARSSEEIKVRVWERSSGELTVTVTMFGWTAQHFTSLPQNKLLQSKIANKVALAVYDFFLERAEKGG